MPDSLPLPAPEISRREFPEVRKPCRFTGDRVALRRLLWRNSLLTLLTLGLYRFWAKTSERQYFWGHTRFLNSPFEYTGRPVELLLGFLMALGILGPLGALYAAILGAAETLSTGYWLTAKAGYYFALFLLVQVGLYRLWRYRLSRTTWRAIRFRQEGSARGYLALSLRWLPAVLATLGYALPWARLALARYRLERTHYGSLPFRWQGDRQDLTKAFVLAWTPFLATGMALVAWGVGKYLATVPVKGQLVALEAAADGVSLPLALAVLCAVPFWSWYRAYEFRFLVRGLGIGDAAFGSRFATFRVFLWVVRLALLVLLVWILGVAVGMALVGGLPPIAQFTSVPTVVVVFHLAFYPVLSGLYFRYPLACDLAATLVLRRTEVGADAEVRQSADRGPEQGEGFADALDIGAF